MMMYSRGGRTRKQEEMIQTSQQAALRTRAMIPREKIRRRRKAKIRKVVPKETKEETRATAREVKMAKTVATKTVVSRARGTVKEARTTETARTGCTRRKNSLRPMGPRRSRTGRMDGRTAGGRTGPRRSPQLQPRRRPIQLKHQRRIKSFGTTSA